MKRQSAMILDAVLAVLIPGSASQSRAGLQRRSPAACACQVIDDQQRYGGNAFYPKVGAEFRNTFASFATSSSSGLPGEPVPTGQIVVSDQQTGLCWDTLGSTTTLAQWSCNSGDNQRFDLLKYADGSYALCDAITGRCVDNGGSADNGSGVGMDACGKPGEGQFWIWANGRGGTSISNKASSKCVEPGWNNVTQGEQAFIQWDCWGGINQSFDVTFTSGNRY